MGATLTTFNITRTHHPCLDSSKNSSLDTEGPKYSKASRSLVCSRFPTASSIASPAGMPKKRQHQHLRSFKPCAPASPTLATSSSTSAGKSGPFRLRHPKSLTIFALDQPSSSRSVNDLLANLRRSSLGPSASRESPSTTPSVPPAIREILQIPETPGPAPRRRVRPRFDGSGRRLPAGPPPPRSWVTSQDDSSNHGLRSHAAKLSLSRASQTTLPGSYLPQKGSLIEIILRNIAVDWEFHRVYNQYHLYFLPNHLKAPLVRMIGVSNGGVSISDLKLILLPPPDVYDDDLLGEKSSVTTEVTCLDLSASLGRPLKLKEVTELLYPTKKDLEDDEPEDSWDTASEVAPSPPRVLLPNLTHLSLALDPQNTSGGSWKQLLAFSQKASNITHLSLAYWPEPCLTPRARYTSISSPQGKTIAYSGTNYYSHSLDHDWSEALLILRKLSRQFYELEFLDLTGCARWFPALMAESDHDRVDWVGDWGKISELRLWAGWKPGEDAVVSEQLAFQEAMESAGRVEKHIRAARAGRGRFINVERDRLEV